MQTANGHPVTILAIDAESEALGRLTNVLEGAGYCCLTAASAQAARAAAHNATPDLIICDVNLAGQSGTLVCDEVCAETGLAEVPLMFLSAAQSPDIIRRTHTTHGTYYLRKPFDSKVLLQLVEKAVAVPHMSGA